MKNNKNMYIYGILAAVLVVLAIFIPFILNRDNASDQPGRGVDGGAIVGERTQDETDTTQGTTPSGSADDTTTVTSPGDGERGQSAFTEPSFDSERPVAPTEARPMHYGDLRPLDPAFGSPDQLAQNFVQEVFTADVSYGGTFGKNYGRLKGDLGTPRLHGTGFPAWYDSHTSEWYKQMDNEGSYVYAFPTSVDGGLMNNDTAVYNVTVDQKVYDGNSMSSKSPFVVEVVMKFIDDKWLVDEMNVIQQPQVY